MWSKPGATGCHSVVTILSSPIADIFMRNPCKPAKEAFNEALDIFKKTLTNDPSKRRLVDGLQATSTLQDVLNMALKAQKHYEDGVSKSKILEGLRKLSQRLMYYGNVMDVLVQHHPEYVSLAWGAMKFIFGVSTCAKKPPRSLYYYRLTNKNIGRRRTRTYGYHDSFGSLRDFRISPFC